MSGRKGLGVKADDLIDRLEADALRRSRRASSGSCRRKTEDDTAHEIAVGALRYFLLKFTRNTVIAFDFKEALSFEGETGPYCQYAAVRANSIFRKLGSETRLHAADALMSEQIAGDAALQRESCVKCLAGEAGTKSGHW